MEKREKEKGGKRKKREMVCCGERGGGREGEKWRQSATLRETKLPLSAFFGEIGIWSGRHNAVRQFAAGKLATLTHSLALSLSRPKFISVQPFFLLLLCSSSNSSGESMPFYCYLFSGILGRRC